jgi:hypothetical protein
LGLNDSSDQQRVSQPLIDKALSNAIMKRRLIWVEKPYAVLFTIHINILQNCRLEIGSPTSSDPRIRSVEQARINLSDKSSRLTHLQALVCFQGSLVEARARCVASILTVSLLLTLCLSAYSMWPRRVPGM